ncbi:MAG TPA: serine hydrolase [Pyrinomonadaceae bacterium]
MPAKRLLSFVLALFITTATMLAPFSQVFAQGAAQAQAASSAPETDARLAAIEKKIEAKRKEYGIPGVSLVIVKDDQIIYLKGLGFKDLEKNIAVTPDTLFAIGSTTKAFTALTVLMSADEGKLTLDDSPKKYLPYFKLYDPEADAKITIRDLLSHSSGLNRTDLALAVGTLNREEVIRVAGQAHPTAKFREKFQYQNIMFTVAGEVAAHAQGKPWEDLIRERIFKPLGMKSSDLSVKEMENSRDFSYGYTYNTDTKQNKRVRMLDIPQAAPAGAINSSARDMAEWLRFMLAGGVHDGKRLVSEKSFTEFTSKQMKVGGNIDYGLGWFLRDWHGHKVIEHGGNIDGFNAEVALMPDQKLGFVLLTNISASPLGEDAREAVWSNLVGKAESAPVAESKPAASATADPLAAFVGTYKFAEAGMNVEVTMAEGKLVMTVPNQPKYTLENVSGQRYKLTSPGLEGFYATFRPSKDNPTETELYLEQPQGNYVLQRLKAEENAKASKAVSDFVKESVPLKDLIGTYRVPQSKVAVEVAERDGKVVLLAPGNPPLALVEKENEKGAFSLGDLPDSYKLNVKRDAAGNINALVATQPEGVFTFEREKKFESPITVDELMSKVIAASGGEALRKHKTMVTTFTVDYIHQGISGEGTIFNKAPNLQATNSSMIALGKKIATTYEYFDGTNGGQDTSFTPSDTFTGKQLAAAKLGSNFYGLLDWKTLFKTVEIKRMEKVGDEDTYVVVMKPEEGNPVTLYVSAKTFLPLRRDTIYSTSDSSGIELPITETYSDYRTVDGVMMPFHSVTKSLSDGDIIVQVKDVKFDVDIPDTAFRPQAKK